MFRSTIHALRSLALVLITCLVSTQLWAQSDLTSVAGTIRDPSGATVPNATVTIRNTGTGAERKATTDAAGTYNIPSVSAGAYDVTVTAPGFERFQQSGN